MKSGLRFVVLTASTVALGACSVDVDTTGGQPAQQTEATAKEAPAKKESPECIQAMAIENMAIGSVLTSAAKALSAPEGPAMEAADDVHRRATEHARKAQENVIRLCID